MGFGTAVSTCMRKFVTFSGRAPRAEYWWFVLFTSIISVVVEFIEPIVGVVTDLVFLLPTLSVAWRRMHDIGKHGAWSLCPVLGLIPAGIGLAAGVNIILYIGLAITIGLAIYFFVLTITRGEEGSNLYGPDPYGMSYDPSVFD